MSVGGNKMKCVFWSLIASDVYFGDAFYFPIQALEYETASYVCFGTLCDMNILFAWVLTTFLVALDCAHLIFNNISSAWLYWALFLLNWTLFWLNCISTRLKLSSNRSQTGFNWTQLGLTGLNITNISIFERIQLVTRWGTATNWTKASFCKHLRITRLFYQAI